MGRVERRRGPLRIVLAAGALALAGPSTAQEETNVPTEAAPTPSEPDAPLPTESHTAKPTPQPVAPAAAKPLAAPPTPTERAWVRGEVRVNYRASASPTSTPLGVLTTGADVGVIERRNGWARILVGENSVGWLPESYLDSEPPPREHLAMLEAQVADLQKSLDETEREGGSLRAQVAELSGKEAERDEEMRKLRDENRDLQAGERWPYMVMGAGILAIGFVVGLLFRSSTRRSSARLRY